MHIDDQTFTKENIPEAFGKYFKNKVENLADTCRIDNTVYNGMRIIHSDNEFFMTKLNILKIMKNLKIKNCEGFDRIPLRILNEGAERLVHPLADLFKLIYEQKSIPEQWKTAKIIPLLKKGAKDDITNYRPISNLCTISKIYEKLILQQLLKISKSNHVDLTGELQHGFKENRSTITAALNIQSIISRAIDEDNYYLSCIYTNNVLL